jgi:hypothetical protein
MPKNRHYKYCCIFMAISGFPKCDLSYLINIIGVLQRMQSGQNNLAIRSRAKAPFSRMERDSPKGI